MNFFTSYISEKGAVLLLGVVSTKQKSAVHTWTTFQRQRTWFWFWMWMVLISKMKTTKEITHIYYLIRRLKDRRLKSPDLQRNSNYALSRLSLEKNKTERFVVKCEATPICQNSTEIWKEILRLVLIEYGNVSVWYLESNQYGNGYKKDT